MKVKQCVPRPPASKFANSRMVKKWLAMLFLWVACTHCLRWLDWCSLLVLLTCVCVREREKVGGSGVWEKIKTWTDPFLQKLTFNLFLGRPSLCYCELYLRLQTNVYLPAAPHYQSINLYNCQWPEQSSRAHRPFYCSFYTRSISTQVRAC